MVQRHPTVQTSARQTAVASNPGVARKRKAHNLDRHSALLLSPLVYPFIGVETEELNGFLFCPLYCIRDGHRALDLLQKLHLFLDRLPQNVFSYRAETVPSNLSIL
jgi:hypothetical protein